MVSLIAGLKMEGIVEWRDLKSQGDCILRGALIMLIVAPLGIVPKCRSGALLNLYFKTTCHMCHVKQHFLSHMNGLKIERPVQYMVYT